LLSGFLRSGIAKLHSTTAVYVAYLKMIGHKATLNRKFLALSLIISGKRQSALQINQPLLRIVPFKLDKLSASKPTSFEFIFEAEKVKYVYYTFKADKKTLGLSRL